MAGFEIQPTQSLERCPLCQRRAHLPYGSGWEFGIRWCYRVCAYCGLVFQSPRLTEDQREQFYQSHYWAAHVGLEVPDEAIIQYQKRRAAHLLSLAPHEGAIHCLMDVGSATGVALEVAREMLGCEVVGVEPSDSFRAFGQKRGLTMYPSLEAWGEQGGRVDLVMMSHVLEHLPDPVAYLKRLRTEAPQPEGYILIEVPNVLAQWCYEAPHLMCFSPRTLEATFEQAGFRVVTLKLHGNPRQDRFQKRPLYIAALGQITSGQPAHPVLRAPLLREALQRQFNLLRGTVGSPNPLPRRIAKGIRAVGRRVRNVITTLRKSGNV